MRIYVTLHHHGHGVSVKLTHGATHPTEAQLQGLLEEDFESDKEERLETFGPFEDSDIDCHDDLPATTELARCASCAWVDEQHLLLDIKDIRQRVAPGEPMPAGECPRCGALAHLIERGDDTGLAVMLDLSAEHVPDRAAPDFGPLRYVAHEHGWTVFVRSNGDEPVPLWLVPIVRRAERVDAILINFDSDAPMCGDFLVYEE